MKGCVFDIRHYAVHDGPGIRTAVFLKGCPLRCRWCHNPEGLEQEPAEIILEKRMGDKLIHIPDTLGRLMTADEVADEVLKSRMFFEESGGGVTFTGGEPLMQADFLEACISALRKHHLHIAIDTCGYARPELFDRIAGQADVVLFDLKHSDNKVHTLWTGASLEPVMRNLKSAALSNLPLYVRIPLVPGFNMSTEIYNQMADILWSLKSLQQVDILPYHSIASHKYSRLGLKYQMNDVRPSSKKEVNEVVSFFRDKGFRVSLGG